ncbi:MAG: glycosyltransferase family 2 protein [Pyrinomonadaceae bacterium]|nr:glycosyltransferase family 2 protein [Pyrinomonadaceae bacterium]
MNERCTYLLPIRRVRFNEAEAADFGEYFKLLAAAGCEVLVVDGSPSDVFNQHEAAWACLCRHTAVDPQHTYLNGKVNGIHTGVALASFESIIQADDDIRYTADNINRICSLLEEYEMVRPQNFLRPLPWWARMEAARMLVNRALLPAGDYPGTCGFRRTTFRRVGHYDGDVLFDNEEIVRHFRLRGANILYANDFFILKRPPTLAKWLEQRPRQAYEDFVMRLKTFFFLLLIPLALLLLFSFGWKALLIYVSFVSFGSALLAIRGRRNGANKVFPFFVCLYAPLWFFERSLSSYWALYWRARHGGYPFGDRLLVKGTGRAWVAGGKTRLQ